MINHEHLCTHLYAVVRDPGESLMTICERIEFCVMNECVAVFEGRWLDYHYFVRGASFHIYKGRKLIRTAGTHINFSQHTALGQRIDRFAISSYDFCHLLQAIYQAAGNQLGEWRCTSIEREFAHWLVRRDAFNPHLLAFLCSDTADRIAYSPQPLTD